MQELKNLNYLSKLIMVVDSPNDYLTKCQIAMVRQININNSGS
ncbi:MAG: hypothetical protein Satyrvirus44_4 [Satyrvirus sp.]|uniref:Uncharacterized protein n=1 Tax=Satyrvirus sp. TaxID=2487771 RepID=A0A3G5AJM8_9VIRU|nr:MAG: hypothetical protein Satyrvirus44_4 [Satyrvirus sp.]